MAVQQPEQFYGTGRRKAAVARVFLRPGEGKILVNGKEFQTYFRGLLRAVNALQGFRETGTAGRFEWLQTAAAPAGIFMGQVLVRGTTVYVSGGYSGGTATFDGITLTVPATQPTAFVAALADPALLPAQPATDLGRLTVVRNPAHASTTVQLPALAGPAATLTLLDALGRPVRTEALQLATTATTHPLPLAGLAPGLYLVRLEAGGTTATRRLVVE